MNTKGKEWQSCLPLIDYQSQHPGGPLTLDDVNPKFSVCFKSFLVYHIELHLVSIMALMCHVWCPYIKSSFI